MTYTSQYPIQDTDHVKATTTNSFGNNWQPWYATDPTKLLTGTDELTSWLSDAWVTDVNQRFHIDLGSAKIIKRIYFENMFAAGIAFVADRGMKNFTFWGSNNAGAFAELTYGTDTNWTEITVDDSHLEIHSTTDQSEPQYALATNTTAYRYYAFKFPDNYGRNDGAGFRRVELQTEDAPIVDLPLLHWNILDMANPDTVESDPASIAVQGYDGSTMRVLAFEVDLSTLPVGSIILAAHLYFTSVTGIVLRIGLTTTYNTSCNWSNFGGQTGGYLGGASPVLIYPATDYGWSGGTTLEDSVLHNIWFGEPNSSTPDTIVPSSVFMRVQYLPPPPVPSFGKINGMEYGDINKVEGVAISSISKIMTAVIGH
jgi:hypothetical protein